ncbi:MAG: helix-turn-helix transcriptional regulator [Atopobiaceae bacterium]|nr:helix-turn-helix transcriptional regulator [Atopobiaceae bacterium]
MPTQRRVSPVIVRAARQVGENLSTWRRIERITAAELAARAGVSVDTVRRAEHGDPSVGMGKILSMARVLDILPLVVDAFDPATTEMGRMRLAQEVPKRVRRQ